MKLTFTKTGKLTATAQSLQDITVLLTLKAPNTTLRTHKPHKKHNHKKTCDVCGKQYKGMHSLGIHKAKCKRDESPSSLPVSLSNVSF